MPNSRHEERRRRATHDGAEVSIETPVINIKTFQEKRPMRLEISINVISASKCYQLFLRLNLLRVSLSVVLPFHRYQLNFMGNLFRLGFFMAQLVECFNK